MKSRHYTFVSVWHINAPVSAVENYLFHMEDWPKWWKGVTEVEILEAHPETNGVGSVISSTWKSWLPYSIHFVLTTTEVTLGKRLAANAAGDLVGTGIWEFSETNGKTTVTYTWDVRTTKWWMNLIGPIASPIFKHAHNVVMKWGEEGMQRTVAALSQPL